MLSTVRSDIYHHLNQVLRGNREHTWSNDDHGTKVMPYCVFCDFRKDWNPAAHLYWPCCTHCKHPPNEHHVIGVAADGITDLKCLFEPTNYQEMTCEEYFRFTRDPDRADLR